MNRWSELWIFFWGLGYLDPADAAFWFSSLQIFAVDRSVLSLRLKSPSRNLLRKYLIL